MRTLADALPDEIERVQGLIPIYESVPMGHIAAGFMKASLRHATEAMVAGDVVQMLEAFKDLKGYEA